MVFWSYTNDTLEEMSRLQQRGQMYHAQNRRMMSTSVMQKHREEESICHSLCLSLLPLLQILIANVTSVFDDPPSHELDSSKDVGQYQVPIPVEHKPGMQQDSLIQELIPKVREILWQGVHTNSCHSHEVSRMNLLKGACIRMGQLATAPGAGKGGYLP